MAYVYVSIGSNINRAENVRASIDRLKVLFGELSLSRVYETAAVGFEGQPFYNLVAGFETDMSPQDLVETLRRIENEQGRERLGKRFNDRTLDLDLLLYDNLILDEDGLSLPRDEILKYAFVLGPLAEIAGDRLHPVRQRSYQSLWEDFDASGQPMTPIEF